RSSGNKGLGPGITMQAADRRGPRLPKRGAGPGANRLDPRLAFAKRQPLGAAADDAAPDQPERRRTDDAKQRYPVGYQRQVDGEFVAAGDEFLGAVERVDQKEAVSIGQRGLLGALFRQRRYVRNQSRETCGDDAVGRQIRLRYRRSVGLAIDLHGGTVDGKDGGASPGHDLG